MPKYELTGAVRLITDTQTFASGFTKREFVVETEDGKYPQLIKLEVVKDNVAKLDKVSINDVVNVSFDIRGSEYKERHYVNLVAWKVTATGETAQPTATGPGRDVPASEAMRKPASQHQAAKQDGYAPDNSANDEVGDEIPFSRKPAPFQP
jgi:hypothetical protein